MTIVKSVIHKKCILESKQKLCMSQSQVMSLVQGHESSSSFAMSVVLRSNPTPLNMRHIMTKKPSFANVKSVKSSCMQTYQLKTQSLLSDQSK